MIFIAAQEIHSTKQRALRDADAAQFDPKYAATLESIQTLKAFEDHSFLGVDNQNAASKVIDELRALPERTSGLSLANPE